MNVNKITRNFTSPYFGALSNNKRNHKSEVESRDDINYQSVPSDKLRSALKATVLIPAAALPLLMGSCINDPEDYWERIYPGTDVVYPAIHVLPDVNVDSLTFSNDTVRISRNLSVNSALNNSLNNAIDALGMPKTHDGEYPARLVFKTPDYIQYMKLNGDESDNDKYVYDTEKYGKDGSFSSYITEFTTDGQNLNMKEVGLNYVSDYQFRVFEDTVEAYKKSGNNYVKDAVYYPSDDRNYSIIRISEQGDTTKISDIDLFCLKPDNENN